MDKGMDPATPVEDAAYGECPACIARGKTWNGSDPRCAFMTGTFDGDNWSCATMGKLRDACEDRAIWNEDQYGAIIPAGDCGEYLVMSWYKHRGCTEGAWLVDGGKILPLTLKAAEAIAKAYEQPAGKRRWPHLRDEEWSEPDSPALLSAPEAKPEGSKPSTIEAAAMLAKVISKSGSQEDGR